MKLGLGLYRNLLNDANFRFAKQAGASHLVVHLVNYFDEEDPKISSGSRDGWGAAGDTRMWQEDALKDLVKQARSHGLEIAAIENFDPTQWSDVLLDGPRKQEQMEQLKRLVQSVGRAGIPCIGYCFSIGGVWGWTRGPYARGGAQSVAFDVRDIDPDEPIPDGMVWNMRVRPGEAGKRVPPVPAEEVWQRLQWFQQQIMPVAEEAGVTMAIHPEDPPMPSLRGIARVLNKPERLLRLKELHPSPANQVELCLGTVQEMQGDTHDTYQALEALLQEKRVAYVHFRNVQGKVPRYQEVFVDEGDLDMPRVVSILHRNHYEGVLVPDHTPALECAASWHAGMAYAMGYLRALMQCAERGQLQVKP